MEDPRYADPERLRQLHDHHLALVEIGERLGHYGAVYRTNQWQLHLIRKAAADRGISLSKEVAE